MSYQKHWVSSFPHKSRRMMNMCGGTTIRKYLAEVTVEPVLFLYMLSTFSQYALFQDLVYSKVCWTKYSKDSDICQNLHDDQYKLELEEVQRLSSHWILMSTISLVIPSFLIAMYLGSWSDRFGRKWPVVFPPMGGVCACLVYIVISVIEEAPVGWICLASLLSGLTGGFVSCIMSCMTYVAAISTEEHRTVRISRLEAMTFFGGTIGPFVSGSMLDVTGHAYAFFYMMLCYAFAFLYAILFVKDINQDGVIIMEHDSGSNLNGVGCSKGGRSRNKSSDTIPSSMAATTLSTSSGEDIEQKERLLSASDLHVANLSTPPPPPALPPSDENCSTRANKNEGFSSVSVESIEEGEGVVLQQQQHHQLANVIEHQDHEHVHDDAEKQGKEVLIEANEICGIPQLNIGETAVAAAGDADHHQDDNHEDNKNNRNSVGSSSGRNSSLHGHDDGSSSAASDDDQRKMIRRRRHSSTLMDEDDEIRRGGGGSSASSCCYKYFNTAHFVSAVVTVVKKRENGKRTLLILSLLAAFIFMVITAGEMDVAYLFARAEPLKWDYKTYSYYFGFKYGVAAFVLLVATPCLKNFGVEDSTLAIVGIISRMAALVIYGLSVNTYMAFSVPAVAIFSVFTIPATRSLLSKLVHPDEQGKMFAFVAMMEDVCTLSASLIFNSIYPLTRPILQGLIFLLAAGVLIIPILIMCFVRWKMLRILKRLEISRRIPHLHSVEGTDPAALLCNPKDFQGGGGK